MARLSSKYPRAVPFQPPPQRVPAMLRAEQAPEWQSALEKASASPTARKEARKNQEAWRTALEEPGPPAKLPERTRKWRKVLQRVMRFLAILTGAVLGAAIASAYFLSPLHKPGADTRETSAVSPSVPSGQAMALAHLYQSYLNVGLLADAVENRVYTLPDAKKLLRAVLTQMAAVDRQFGQTRGSIPQPTDANELARLEELTALVRMQARELLASWETPGDDDAKQEHESKYHRARKKAWVGIQELLARDN